MTVKFLLDTNIVSEPLRPKPAETVMRCIVEHEGQMAIPSLVWHELRFGCARLDRSLRRTAIERYLDDVVFANLPILDYDDRAADWHAFERARLSALGKTTHFVDGQIAAIAQVNDLTLVTANTDDFRQFRDLMIENWF